MSFRPQQGLTIMNGYEVIDEFERNIGFRPQQGLTIMNGNMIFCKKCNEPVSVPNRG